MEWLRSNAGSILVLSVLALIVAGILYRMIRDKRKGQCGCTGCSGCCGKDCGRRKE